MDYYIELGYLESRALSSRTIRLREARAKLRDRPAPLTEDPGFLEEQHHTHA
jgi:hypothetical protein